MTARQPNGANPKPVVLVLQDEPILAGIMRDFVEEAGCEAVVVRTAEAAVHILEGRTDIRVVFADLDVRGSTTGLKLIAMIRERWPPIELVLTGALAPDLDAIPARGVFCDKPFRENKVISTIRSFAA